MTPQERIDAAMVYISEYGYIDGEHHKQWVLDQVARCLLQDAYDEWANDPSDADCFEWDTGIAP
jgi:hypothetical protein